MAKFQPWWKQHGVLVFLLVFEQQPLTRSLDYASTGASQGHVTTEDNTLPPSADSQETPLLLSSTAKHSFRYEQISSTAWISENVLVTTVGPFKERTDDTSPWNFPNTKGQSSEIISTRSTDSSTLSSIFSAPSPSKRPQNQSNHEGRATDGTASPSVLSALSSSKRSQRKFSEFPTQTPLIIGRFQSTKSQPFFNSFLTSVTTAKEQTTSSPMLPSTSTDIYSQTLLSRISSEKAVKEQSTPTSSSPNTTESSPLQGIRTASTERFSPRQISTDQESVLQENFEKEQNRNTQSLQTTMMSQARRVPSITESSQLQSIHTTTAELLTQSENPAGQKRVLQKKVSTAKNTNQSLQTTIASTGAPPKTDSSLLLGMHATPTEMVKPSENSTSQESMLQENLPTAQNTNVESSQTTMTSTVTPSEKTSPAVVATAETLTSKEQEELRSTETEQQQFLFLNTARPSMETSNKSFVTEAEGNRASGEHLLKNEFVSESLRDARFPEKNRESSELSLTKESSNRALGNTLVYETEKTFAWSITTTQSNEKLSTHTTEISASTPMLSAFGFSKSTGSNNIRQKLNYDGKSLPKNIGKAHCDDIAATEQRASPTKIAQVSKHPFTHMTYSTLSPSVALRTETVLTNPSTRMTDSILLSSVLPTHPSPERRQTAWPTSKSDFQNLGTIPKSDNHRAQHSGTTGQRAVKNASKGGQKVKPTMAVDYNRNTPAMNQSPDSETDIHLSASSDQEKLYTALSPSSRAPFAYSRTENLFDYSPTSTATRASLFTSLSLISTNTTQLLQMQRSSEPEENTVELTVAGLAGIIVASVLGSAVLTATIAYCWFTYRIKKKMDYLNNMRANDVIARQARKNIVTDFVSSHVYTEIPYGSSTETSEGQNAANRRHQTTSYNRGHLPLINIQARMNINQSNPPAIALTSVATPPPPRREQPDSHLMESRTTSDNHLRLSERQCRRSRKSGDALNTSMDSDSDFGIYLDPV